MFGSPKTHHRLKPANRGQALVELAIILPVMLLLFGAALDLGRFFYGQITITHAAKEGAFEAARNPTSFASGESCDPVTNRVVCRVLNEMRGSSYTVTPADISLRCSVDPCPANPVIGQTVEVRVQGRFALATPILEIFLGGRTVTTSSAAVAQLGVDPEPGTAATPSPSPTPDPTPTPETPETAGTPDPSASVEPSPEASVAPSPSLVPVCEKPTVTGTIKADPMVGSTSTVFTFNAPGVKDQPGCDVTYTWSFGDGGSGSGETILYQFAKKGTGPLKQHTVTLAISVAGVPLTWIDSVKVAVN
jgi:Flp pilus assembly protein TadG